MENPIFFLLLPLLMLNKAYLTTSHADLIWPTVPLNYLVYSIGLMLSYVYDINIK